MKKQILALVFILLFCGFGITVPYFIQAHNERKTVIEQKSKNEEFKKMLSIESSREDTILESEISDIELEDYNREQIYIIGIDALYDYFQTINQVEDIRQRIEFYINQNIDENIKEAVIDGDSIISENDNMIFSVKAGYNDFEVRILRSKSSTEVNIIQ